MPYFRYKATNQDNQNIEGMIQAASAEVAAELLEDRNYTILSLTEEKRSLIGQSLKIFNRVKSKDLVIFSRQLSVIISATIPLVQGLKILVNQTESKVLKSIISEIGDDVEGGATLSAALSRHPEVFSNFFINIIRAGETSGKLDEVLQYLADQQEKDYDLSSKIRGAMIYPIFIVAGLFVVGAVMMVSVLPKLTAVLIESGTALPLTTRILIATSNFLSSYYLGLIVVGVLLIVGFRFALSTESGRRIWDMLILKVPIFGPLNQEIVIVRFARSLNTLMTGGVALTKSLEVVSEVVGNTIYKEIIQETSDEVEDGNPIATALLKSSYVPPMVSQMLNLGEKTGRLEEILDKIANFYTREVDNKVTNLVSLLEPVIMILLGVAVGGLVAAILLPMYNLALNM
ncbi:MAG: type II secretion system F family protein [Candidatus Buchananbacteria bacterium]